MAVLGVILLALVFLFLLILILREFTSTKDKGGSDGK
jgi:hypothetical protein